jgi:CheY-like chemotaxis protein
MDIMMPVMNGYDATRAIRSSSHPRAKSIPIIAMTANAYREDVEKAKEAGMNAHVPKPIDMNLLLSLLDSYRGERDS